MSVGRGTDLPFQVVGHPKLKNAAYKFTPVSKPAAKKPLYENQVCFGHDLHNFSLLYVRDYKGLYLFWILTSFKDMPDQDKYFNDFFEKLAGTKTLRQQIIAGKTEEQIKATWRPGIEKFKLIRKKYLLYADF